MRIIILAYYLILSTTVFAQKTSINYELNGRSTNTQIEDSIGLSKNPFAQFIGEWTLKNDTWIQNWGGTTDTILIPKHHTISSQINTDNSLLSIIDGPEPNGHIFWSYNPNTKEVYHLSSFGTIRAGNGKGTINENGDLRLKLFFEGEPEESYRIYNYKWVNNNEYHMNSVQYDENDEPTGLFYEGYFTRFEFDNNKSVKNKTNQDLDVLDSNDKVHNQNAALKNEILEHGRLIREAFAKGDIETINALHHPEVVKALGYNDLRNGRKDVMNGIEGTLNFYNLEFVENDVENIILQNDIAIEQTKFSIKGNPKNGGEPFVFSGRTMVTYIRYDKSPTGWATIREIIQVEN